MQFEDLRSQTVSYIISKTSPKSPTEHMDHVLQLQLIEPQKRLPLMFLNIFQEPSWLSDLNLCQCDTELPPQLLKTPGAENIKGQQPPTRERKRELQKEKSNGEVWVRVEKDRKQVEEEKLEGRSKGGEKRGMKLGDTVGKCWRESVCVCAQHSDAPVLTATKICQWWTSHAWYLMNFWVAWQPCRPLSIWIFSLHRSLSFSLVMLSDFLSRFLQVMSELLC